jgi:phosphohistidine phosphatase
MFLYLVQHGEAKREEEDPLRGLTEKGINEVNRAAHFVAGIPIKPLRIYHSGKARAGQTAAIFAETLRPPEGVVETDAMSPTDHPRVWHSRLTEIEDDVMLVGHLPHLARLAGLLFSGDRGDEAVNFKMGGVVCLERDEAGPWLIEWMVIPEIIR